MSPKFEALEASRKETQVMRRNASHTVGAHQPERHLPLLPQTAATILDRVGYSLEQIGALLAHTRKGVTASYARWDKFDLRREMATTVERSVRETLETGEPAGGRTEMVHRRNLPRDTVLRTVVLPQGVGLECWVVRASSSKYTHARNGLSFLRTGAVHVQAALHAPAKQGHRPVQNADANRLRLGSTCQGERAYVAGGRGEVLHGPQAPEGTD